MLVQFSSSKASEVVFSNTLGENLNSCGALKGNNSSKIDISKVRNQNPILETNTSAISLTYFKLNMATFLYGSYYSIVQSILHTGIRVFFKRIHLIASSFKLKHNDQLYVSFINSLFINNGNSHHGQATNENTSLIQDYSESPVSQSPTDNDFIRHTGFTNSFQRRWIRNMFDIVEQ
ncbi:hypothetical protein GJ496_008846 [Pomphorhynchus laevis]|nr:hypothetical protein GJ496_008846 [Pomphorhynchus laevis]